MRNFGAFLGTALVFLTLGLCPVCSDLTDGNAEYLKREHSLMKPYQGKTARLLGQLVSQHDAPPPPPAHNGLEVSQPHLQLQGCYCIINRVTVGLSYTLTCLLVFICLQFKQEVLCYGGGGGLLTKTLVCAAHINNSEKTCSIFIKSLFLDRHPISIRKSKFALLNVLIHFLYCRYLYIVGHQQGCSKYPEL